MENYNQTPEEKPKNEKLTTVLIVVLAVFILFSCLCAMSCTLGVLWFTSADNETVIDKIFGNEEIPVYEDEEPDTPTIEEQVGEDGSISLTTEQKKILSRAEEIRGLSPQSELSPIFQTQEELRDYLINSLYEDVSESDFADEHDLLTVLGFIPAEMDLESFYLDFYSDQIAGFYDEEDGNMYLIEGGTEKENSLTLAHEYVHVLQFDNFDFPGKLNYSDETCEEESEHCVALDAVIEGDATLTETLLSNDDDLDLASDYSEESSQTSFNQAPKYFQDSLLFPYTYGFDFVYHHYLKGGFEQVDELYSTPPLSAEQIMHPEKYGKDAPVSIMIEPFEDLLEADCEMVIDDTLNEADILWLLDSAHKEDWRISQKDAEKAAAGWGGGAYLFGRYEDKPVFFSKIAWDTQKEADEAFAAFSKYADKRWDKANSSGLRQADEEKALLIQQEDILIFAILPADYDESSLLELINGGSAL